MATYTAFYDGQTLASKQAINADSPGVNGSGVMEYIIDFNTSRFGATAIKATNADILEVFPIPKNSQILYASIEVLTAEGAVFTFNVGDTGSATRMFSAVNGNVVAVTGTAYLDAALPNLYYSAANTVRIAVASGTSIGTAKIRLRVFGVWGSTSV